MAMDIYVPNHAIYYKATSAILTSSAKLVARVFFIILARWTSTVLALMPSSWAMVLFCNPLSKPASTLFPSFAQGRECLFDQLYFRVRRGFIFSPRQRRANCVEQCVVVERLLKEIDRSSFHRGDRQRNIAMRGDDDDRHGDAALFHFCQQIEPAHFRHAHVRHQATAVVSFDHIEECSRGISCARTA